MTSRRPRGVEFRALRKIDGDAFDRTEIRPQACLGQKLDSQSELRSRAHANGNPMKPAAARNLGRRYIGHRNRLLDASPANFEAVAAILDFVHKPMRLCLPEENDQSGAEYSDGDRARQGIAPQVPVQGRRGGDERDQCGCAQPNAPFEQLGILERNDSQRNTPLKSLRGFAPAAYRRLEDRADWC